MRISDGRSDVCSSDLPILWAAQGGGGAAVRLNGVLITLGTSGDPQTGTAEFSAPGTTITVRALGEDADWRANAELVFRLEQGLTVGYGGFYARRRSPAAGTDPSPSTGTKNRREGHDGNRQQRKK